MPRFNDDFDKIALPANRELAINKLFDAANREKTQAIRKQELPVFQLYLNYAVTNIQEIAKLPEGLFREDDMVKELEKKDDQTLQRLANFLWLFKVDNPEQDFGRSYRSNAIAIAKQIFLLRNFFCHPKGDGIAPLVVNHNFYQFFAGWLSAEARDHSLKLGVKTNKIYEMKIMNVQEKNDDRSKQTYAFTRKGIILLTCLALYKDDATEFLQAMHDMKLTTRELIEEGDEEEIESARKKASSRKAFHEMFTYFSMRRSYGAVNSENHDWACFTDIIGYLNKVPGVSLDYLALDNERNMLAQRAAESTESDENKEFKYTLHRRRKERFLSFLAAYCEDFNIIPSIHFKRLDISEHIGRKRYRFGFENDNSVRQSRHYAIEKDAIRFEFRPTQHYGDIHIDSLRGAVSATELRHILLAHDRKVFDAEKELNAYFTAYHKILEKMLNEPECDFIDRTGYLPELRAVTGASEEMLLDDGTFKAVMAPYFPENLTRFFIPQDNIPSVPELRQKLLQGIGNEIKRDDDLLARMDRFDQHQKEVSEFWEKHPARTEEDEALFKKEVSRLPQDCRFSDGFLIARVFDLLNLYLPVDRKFRQLPKGKQHRQCLDYEYQTVHAIIGRFSKNPSDLWDKLKGQKTLRTEQGTKFIPLDDAKRRPELSDVAEQLRSLVSRELKAEEKYMESHPKFGANGRPVRPSYTLMMLAKAAVALHKSFCESKKKHYQADRSSDLEQVMKDDCRIFGIRLGMQLTHEAIVKTILHIDIAKWENAYNYQENCPWQNRNLASGGHIVTQVPLTNDFATIHARQAAKRKDLSDFFNAKGDFDFSAYCRLAFIPQKTAKISLRDFYDVSPLVKFAKTKDATGTAWAPERLAEFPKETAEPTKAELSKAVGEIKDVRTQDAILLYIAQKYHERYASSPEVTENAKLKFSNCSTVYEYFESEEVIELKGGLKVRLKPNDRLRSMFAQIRDYSEKLVAMLSADEKGKPVNFYDLAFKFRRIQAADRRVRIEYFSKIMDLERRVDEPVYPDTMSKEEQHKALYSLYLPRTLGKKKKMTFEEFESLIGFRNQIFHKGFAISDEDCAKADKVLRYFGIGVDDHR